MKYLPDDDWQKLPIPQNDYRPRFFIELYQEAVNLHTPISYQPRIMSLFSYIEEILDLINNYKKHISIKDHIIRSINEFIKYLENDISARTIYKKEKDIINNYKNISELTANDINKLELLMKLFLDQKKEKEYWRILCKNLTESVCDDSLDLDKKRRVLDLIDNSCKIFLSHILNKGASKKYLFNRSDQFKRKNNYKTRKWNEQLKKVIDSFDEKKKDFSIFFMIEVSPKLELINENISKSIQEYNIFKEKESIGQKRIIKFSRFSLFDEQSKSKERDLYILKFKNKSYSYDNALLKAKEELSILDFLSVNYKVDIMPNALIIEKNNSTYHDQIVSVDDYLDNNFFLLKEEINLSSVSDKLTSEALGILKSSLRYFRLAKQSKSIEQKLINTWIAIESLYIKSKEHESSDKKKSSLIENIIHYVPMIYNSFSIIRKIRYAKKILVSNKIKITSKIRSELDIKDEHFSNYITDNDIWKIMQRKDLFDSLMEDKEIEFLEHLKYRLTIIYEFCQKGEVLKNFDKSKYMIENQLYRIYYMRNKITHSGEHNNINYDLLTHLTDYLVISYAAIVIGCKYLPQIESIQEFSILDILGCYEIEYKNLTKKIEGNDILELNNIFINEN